jgi:hypothetical protein
MNSDSRRQQETAKRVAGRVHHYSRVNICTVLRLGRLAKRIALGPDSQANNLARHQPCAHWPISLCNRVLKGLLEQESHAERLQ